MILQKILGECTSVKFLSTSRIQLNQVGNTEEVVHELKHLSNEWAVDLFLEKANLNLNDLKDQEEVQKFLDHTEW